MREARLSLLTRLLQRLGVRVLVPLHRRRPGCLREAWNDGRLLRLQAARRLKTPGRRGLCRIDDRISLGASLLGCHPLYRRVAAVSQQWSIDLTKANSQRDTGPEEGPGV